MYKEHPENNSKYRNNAENILLLLKENTLISSIKNEQNRVKIITGLWTFNIPYFNADGHGYFDTFTIFIEMVLVIPFNFIGSQIFGRAEGYPPVPLWVLPGIFINYTFWFISFSIVILYDCLFHDILVILSKVITYPYHLIFKPKKKEEINKLNNYEFR
jgi:hypothetical protein